MVYTEKQFKDRFYSRTEKVNGCWEWTGALFKGGYGCVVRNRKTQGAHRVSYKISVGEIPEKMFVCHKCDNRKCINPEHLFLGTYRDNIDDMVKKKRSLIGENNPSSKLTEKQVLEIRKRYIPRKMSIRKLAKEYGIVSNAINQIIKRTKWKHI